MLKLPKKLNEQEKEKLKKVNISLFCILLMLLGGLFFMFNLASCSYSFQNVMTEGTAEDVVDTNQTQEPQTEAQVELPIAPDAIG